MPALSDIPAHVRDAFTPQMRRVVEHQLEHAARRSARQGAGSAGEATGDDAGSRAAEAEGALAAARAEYREERAFWNVGGPTMHETNDLSIRTSGKDVPVRMHRPSADETLPAIVYFHGGGFIVGDLDTHDRITRVLAAVSGAAVVAVDYTLAPEGAYPVSLHESAGVLAHLAAHGGRYGIDGSRLAVAGDSAGAMLALGATLLLRDEPGRLGDEADDAERAFASLSSMLLYYGGYGLADSVSARLYGGFWDGMAAEDLRIIDDVFLTRQEDRTSRYTNLLSADLEAPLPPAYVIGADLDPLRDDSFALAQRLETAGHDVQRRVVPGVLHSFLHFGRMLDEANEAIAGGAMFARSRFFS
ncbi:alpha/beta hydrolase fold domain-containing protein [Microbacterium halotolerans]|uniref:alpha/beta hydrolase fold domain-containing protein n=1 Tax=Microbacterium halotolerans TaxID=246613 RepID=UPI001F09D1C5|nr:alpha/beta hydrolase fold domain-containing protein [Microbacterium halotolerans]